MRGNRNPDLCSLQILFLRRHPQLLAPAAAAARAPLRHFAVTSLLQNATRMESLPAVLRCANLVPPCATAAPSTAAAATGLPLPRFAWDSKLRCHLQLLHHSRNLLFPAISLPRAFFDPARRRSCPTS